jgi:hypothetical protein
MHVFVLGISMNRPHGVMITKPKPVGKPSHYLLPRLVRECLAVLQGYYEVIVPLASSRLILLNDRYHLPPLQPFGVRNAP